MDTTEIVKRMNVLLEAERAGVRILKPLAARPPVGRSTGSESTLAAAEPIP